MCIAAGELVNKTDASDSKLAYFAVMTDNCLNSSAQFRYVEIERLQNIEKYGTLISPIPYFTEYKSRWAVYRGLRGTALSYETKPIHRLKQTDVGSLRLYNMKEPVCADLEAETTYVKRNKICDKYIQRFTFGK